MVLVAALIFSLVAPQIHGSVPHGTSTGSTPPFSYNISEAGSLGQQPLVSFSPPFDTAHVDARGHGDTDTHSTGMRIRNARTPVPVHLDTLPESPFSLKGSKSAPPLASRTLAASFSRPPLLPPSLGSNSLEPQPESRAGADKTEVSVTNSAPGMLFLGEGCCYLVPLRVSAFFFFFLFATMLFVVHFPLRDSARIS